MASWGSRNHGTGLVGRKESDDFHRRVERRRARHQAAAAAGQPRQWEGRPASRMMLSSPFRRGLCTGSSFQQTLRQRMREVSPSCPAGRLTPPSRAAAASSPGVASPLTSGRVRKRGGGWRGSRSPRPCRVRRKLQQGPQRRMVDHLLPPYGECNFSLHFMMVRAPGSATSRARSARRAPSPPPPPERAHVGLTTPSWVSARCPPAGARCTPVTLLARSLRVYQPESSTCSTATTTRTSASLSFAEW